MRVSRVLPGTFSLSFAQRSGRTRTLVTITLTLAAVSFLFIWWRTPRLSEAILRNARKQVYEGRAQQALDQLLPFLNREPADGNVCFLASEALSELKDFEAAAKMFSRVPAEHSKRAESCFREGDILLLQLFRLTDAERPLREALRIKPDHQAAQAHLAALYGLCGLTSLTSGLRNDRLRASQFTELDLVLLALGDTAAENSESLKSYQEVSPEDPMTKLAVAHQHWQQNEHALAQVLYQEALLVRPEFSDAQARLGRILVEQNAASEFLKWHAALPAEAEESAEIWTVRGDWATRQKDPRGAVRCYWEAVRRAPSHRRAHYQLGQTLASLGENTRAESFQRRNEALQELLLAAKQCNLNPSSDAILRTLDAALKCGHSWEVWGWSEAFRKRYPQQADIVSSIVKPSSDTPLVSPELNPAEMTSFADYALPEWMTRSSSDGPLTSEATGAQTSTNSGIRFVDDAERAGLVFQYIHGDEMTGPGMRMFQFSGGGTGVLDYDLDGWPDVYLTQGGRWQLPEDPVPSDVLFRNRRGRSFSDVASAAGISEPHYSQGLAVGDIDGDGWSDLFVANVDGNSLFRNNGDGTFENITETAGVSDTAWSTSAVCADFNGDSLPDLFVVNYLEGDDLLERICHQADGTPRACTPHEFEPAEDQMLLNLGDGRFRDITQEAGLLAPGGKGLGVVAADFDESSRLSLFVGNDTTANFFFQNLTSNAGEIPRFEESAVINGLAFDREGRTQACMGIAAGDVDGDESVDLFVTNYYNESNTLYQRQAGLVFSDTTADSGLREPSIRQLGFGAQFFDADLDGNLDLVVTNGHVDDEIARGIPLHMPTQFFRNSGGARFAEVNAAELGPWFQGKYLGRGVAKLDWNRDGREDLLIGMLDTPTALLTNDSDPVGGSVTIRLVARNSARDSVGAGVRVITEKRTQSYQLTAGDGYQTSNERSLHVTLSSDSSAKLEVRWPSGAVESFEGVQAGTAVIAVEGRARLFSQPQ